MKLNSVLVAMDFSECSIKAFKHAKQLIKNDGEIVLLHVIDKGLTEKLEKLDLIDSSSSIDKLKQHAEKDFENLLKEQTSSSISIDVMIVEGVPFLEILKISRDLDVNMILLGKRSDKDDISQVFFGSNAEKVIRGSSIPVLVIP